MYVVIHNFAWISDQECFDVIMHINALIGIVAALKDQLDETTHI